MLLVLLGLPFLLPTTLLLETVPGFKYSRNIYPPLSIALNFSQDLLPQDKDAISWPHCSNICSFTCLTPKFSCFLLHSLVSFLHLPILGDDVDPAYLQTSPTSQILKSGHELMLSILHLSLMTQPGTGRLDLNPITPHIFPIPDVHPSL